MSWGSGDVVGSFLILNLILNLHCMETLSKPACTHLINDDHGHTTCAGWMQELLEVFAVTGPKRKEFADAACACMCLTDVLVCVLCSFYFRLPCPWLSEQPFKVLVDRISKPASLLEESSH